MAYYTPPPPAIERPPPAIVCLSCGDTMEYVRTISELGVPPGQIVFVCPSCKGVDTKQVKRVT